MAKGQVTTDDLASGMKSFGGLSSLGGAPRPVRDNPFRDTRTEAAPPVVIAPSTPEPAPEAPKLEIIATPPKPEVGEGAKPAPAPRPVREKKSPTPVPAPTIAKTSRVPDASTEQTAREKKTELYTEKVSVLLNAELRDGAEALAKNLQRRRTQKEERITANTIIRVALRAMLESFDPPETLELNSESDLDDAVRKLWTRG